jgi:hypothetical protein
MKRSQHKQPFTAPQKAAILRLYLQQRLSTPETAKRLRLSVDHIVEFLRERGVLRHQGPAIPRKISWEARQTLEGELATNMDVVLARKYGLSRERIRQIRQQLGCPSSRVIRLAWAARVRTKRQKQEQFARDLRRQQRRAKRLLVINRLSQRWKSGVRAAELAQEFGFGLASLHAHIGRLRKEFPMKFPYRSRSRSPRLPGAAVRQQS